METPKPAAAPKAEPGPAQASADDTSEDDEAAPDEAAKVVSLDQFRKK